MTWIDLLAARGISPEMLGIAYLFLVANAAFAGALFMVCRSELVISPNRASRDYGLYMAVLLAALMVAATLENELSPSAATLPYAVFPHMLVLFVVHLWIYYRQEPWLIALGISATAGLVLLVAALGLIGFGILLAHWVTAGVAAALLIFVWLRSCTTRRAFIKESDTIYVSSKELGELAPSPQKPWLGVVQWAALIAASVALAVLNELLIGVGLDQMPALHVMSQAGLVLAITGLISAIPATTYWLAHRSWMPELSRFVWVVWIVVGFAFTYGNYLLNLQKV